MMTSVTLPSTSGPIHSGYSSAVMEETSSDADFESPRQVKRCLVADPCKKRRKQATPVRISAAESESLQEGKLTVPTSDSDLLCAVCQLTFATPELLQSHVAGEHSGECKKEPEEAHGGDSPLQLTTSRSDLQWMNELQAKEWVNLHGLPFTNSMFMAVSSTYPQQDNIPQRQPIRIFNPDAYCELCNKEFCNKYFLKTHKANKHGIYSDPVSSEPPGNTVNIPTYATNIKLPSSVPSSDIKSELKPPLNVMNPFSDVYSNPFSSKHFSKTRLFESEPGENSTYVSNGIANGDVDTKTSEEHTTPDDSSNAFVEPKSESDQETTYYTPSSKLSPGQRDAELSNRLRRIGVMNPKAFCEICCKEYCNKYFLRTHKMKRHGIFIPDDKDKEIKSESSQTLWQNTQTSPLNLIVSEQSERKTTSPTDISCDVCGIKFQNASLAQLHNVSVHSKHEEQIDEKKEENVPDKPLSADAISEDLQKLQTMILQLNDLDVTRSLTTCTACSKEFENRYYLHAHMMTEHGLLLDDISELEKPTDGDNQTSIVCELCGKEVDDLKKHLVEAHPNQPQEPKDDQNGFTTPEKVGRASAPPTQIIERRASMSLTPTSSYCEICNKELCNKYFMKTHMQRMHGIEIENGAQIGGVVCDICNKELCSKYFLRVHKHNTHGIVEYGASLLQPRRADGETAPSENDAALKPADLADLSHRYFTHFTEVCTICSRRFRSTKWLKAHLLSDHGQAGAEKWTEVEQHLQQTMMQHKKSSQSERISPNIKVPNGSQEGQQKLGLQNVLSSLFGADESSAKIYHCSYCPFTTNLMPLLFLHERSHSSENESVKCPVCNQSFLQPDLLQHHMFSQHPFIPLPPFFNGREDAMGEQVNEQTESAEEEENLKNLKMMKKVKRKLTEEACHKEVKRQVPSTYAIPQGGEELSSVNNSPGYVMQGFMIEEESSERRFVPSMVFLPVLQKQLAPISVTFTLTPA